MKIEDAIAKIEQQRLEFLENNLDYAGINEAYQMALFALEKEIEKAPVRIKGRTWFSCPVCGDTYIDNYCGKCGQKIKW